MRRPRNPVPPNTVTVRSFVAGMLKFASSCRSCLDRTVQVTWTACLLTTINDVGYLRTNGGSMQKVYSSGAVRTNGRRCGAAVAQYGGGTTAAGLLLLHQRQCLAAGRNVAADQRRGKRLERDALGPINHRRRQVLIAQPGDKGGEFAAQRHGGVLSGEICMLKRGKGRQNISPSLSRPPSRSGPARSRRVVCQWIEETKLLHRQHFRKDHHETSAPTISASGGGCRGA